MGKRGPKPRSGSVEWSPELAYAIGLIAADGNLSKDGRHLTFVSKDIEQIQNLTRCLGIRVKIGKVRSGKKNGNKEYFRVQWGDVRLCSFLRSAGITQNKSKTIGELAIPDEYFFDFLRGVFDGDGTFYSYADSRWKSSFMYYLVFLSAGHQHIYWIQRTLARLVGVHGHLVRSKTDSVLQVRYAKAESLQVLRYMYPNKKVPHLSRKKLKVSRALRIVGLSLP